MIELPSPAEDERAATGVPWGLPEAAGSVLLTFAIAVIGGGILYDLDRSLYRQNYQVFTIIAEQFVVFGVVISAVLLLLVRGQAGPAVLGFRYPGHERLVQSLAAVPVVLFAVAVLQVVFNLLFPGFLQGNTQEIFPNSKQHIGIALRILILVWAAVEVPLAEETLFRGILYQGLRHFFARWLSYPWAITSGAVVSGIVFALLHGEPHTLPILALLGVVLALVFERTHSVYASSLVHGTINALTILATLPHS